MSLISLGGGKGLTADSPEITTISLDGLTTILSTLPKKFWKESSAVKSGSGQTAPEIESLAISLVGLKSKDDLPDKNFPLSLSKNLDIVSYVIFEPPPK